MDIIYSVSSRGNHAHVNGTHNYVFKIQTYALVCTLYLFLAQNSLVVQGLSQAAPLRQSRTAIGIVPLKNGQGDNLSPSKFREKTQKEAHTKRFISVQKLQAETERGKYILSHL